MVPRPLGHLEKYSSPVVSVGTFMFLFGEYKGEDTENHQKDRKISLKSRALNRNRMRIEYSVFMPV